jgi:acetylornithine/N-succinyldiaminopimelate aminotransferase
MSYLMNTVDVRGRKIVDAKGPYLIGENGEILIDFHSDTGASGLGYNHPQMLKVAKMMERGDAPLHVPNMYDWNDSEEIAGKLCRKAGMDKVFFSNSGSEAVETAIKLARLYQLPKSRHAIWALEGGFHGRTSAALAASTGPEYYYRGFKPLTGGIRRFSAIQEVDSNAAAVMLSPVLGHHDVVPYSAEYLKEIREYCDEHDILLIFDEIQCGSGRTGSYLYSQSVGVEADIVCLAKGMASGFPMGATLARGAVAHAFKPGVHYSTFGGSPAAMAHLNAMLEYLTDNFLWGVREIGELIKDKMRRMGWFTKIDGVGMMIVGHSDIDAAEFARRCEDKGVIIGAWRPNPIRISPVLGATWEQIHPGLEKMDEVYKEMTE